MPQPGQTPQRLLGLAAVSSAAIGPSSGTTPEIMNQTKNELPLRWPISRPAIAERKQTAT